MSESIATSRKAVEDAIETLTGQKYQVPKSRAEALILQADSIKANAYCPYSNFRVGAAVLALRNLGDSGDLADIFTGVNVENASYPVGTCAERVAVGTAVAAGYRHVIAVAVSTDISPPASPCGMCRQFMREFVVDGNVIIIMMGSHGESGAVIKQFGELLPMSFGPENLPDTDAARLNAIRLQS